MGLLAFKRSVAQSAEGHQPEEYQACQRDQQVEQHQLDANGERAHEPSLRLLSSKCRFGLVELAPSGSDKHIAFAVDRANERFLRTGRRVGGDEVFELGAETVHVDVERIFLDLGYIAPGGFDELFARSNQSGPAHKSCEQLELFACQGDVAIVVRGDPASAVECDAASGDGLRRSGQWHAARNGTQTCEKYFEDERLNEVVVGAEVKGADDAWHGIHRSEHEDRCLAMTLTNRFE